MPLLNQLLPEFSEEIKLLLVEAGELRLAEQISDLKIVDRCRCGDSFCATFYTAPIPQPSYGPTHRNVALDPEAGIVILDVEGEEIKCVEVLYRDEIRAKLHALVP